MTRYDFLRLRKWLRVMFELIPNLTNVDFCLYTKMQVACNMSQKRNQVQHDVIKLMHKVHHVGFGYACPIYQKFKI